MHVYLAHDFCEIRDQVYVKLFFILNHIIQDVEKQVMLK